MINFYDEYINNTYKELTDAELREEIQKMETISDHNHIAAMIVKVFRDELNARDNANND